MGPVISLQRVRYFCEKCHMGWVLGDIWPDVDTGDSFFDEFDELVEEHQSLCLGARFDYEAVARSNS